MSSLLRFFSILLIIFSLLAVIGRIFFFDIGKGDNYSMVPAIIPGDIFLFRTIGLLGAGDVAVCKNPEVANDLVVGRIVGVPGDNIGIKNNTIFLNGKPVYHSYVDPIIYFDNSTEESMKYVVRQAEEKIAASVYKVSLMDAAEGKNFREIIVPHDSFFLLGDNRNIARDSRHYGVVPISDCLGEAMFIFWAAPTNGDLVKAERMFSWIR